MKISKTCVEIFQTRMRGNAQPDGRPVVELIETPVLSPVVDQITKVYH